RILAQAVDPRLSPVAAVDRLDDAAPRVDAELERECVAGAPVEQAAELRQQAIAVERRRVERADERADLRDAAVLLARMAAALGPADDDEDPEDEQRRDDDRDGSAALHVRPETSRRSSR